MVGQRRGTALCGRLLLFAALLFGIVAMHSLGHCAEHPASPAAGASVTTAAAHHGSGPEPTAPARTALAHGSMDMTGGTVTAAADGAADGVPRAHAPLPVGGADPAAVCLAVLGAVALVALGAAFARRAPDGSATALARLPYALRPIPPPPHGRLLARISVLRL
ncbi:hypothetical protein [Streptomyces catenulae]|uniref:Lipoprotein n=1 Tax=Streptomyces catenulae TaxID=66875 RepID=A0ABV2YXI7_9ACTN|nr:hypothetical protein [Streptomyces catenulae]